MKPILLLLAAALTLNAADLTGKWSGTSEFVNRGGQTRTDPIYLALEQSGAEVKGTAGPGEQRQRPFENGKLDGNKLTFEIREAEDRKIVVELVVDGDSMAGEAKFHREYGVITAKMKLKRL